MSYGIIEFDEEGNPKCEICGKYFKRVMSHVRQKHHINEREYKLQFGFDLKKGICSEDSSEKTREKTLKNFDKCIGRNLLLKGEKNRFKKGNLGRTKDKVSEQTKIRLTKHAKENLTLEKRKELGRVLGLSGLGNAEKKKNKNK